MEKKVTTKVSDNIFMLHLPGLLFLIICFGLMTFSVMSTDKEKPAPIHISNKHQVSFKYIKPTKFVPKPKPKTQKALFSSDEIAKGKLLVSKGICIACHKIDIKVIGPAFKDIAKKYTATDENILKLVQKIIKGGKGSWGEIPMAPNPQVNEADGKLMVKYILSIK